MQLYPLWGSISSTFNVQLLRAQIPKAQKDTVKLYVFFALLESAQVKALCKMLVKSTPGCLYKNYFLRFEKSPIGLKHLQL